MTAPAAIDVSGLSHRYGEREALRDVSFAVEERTVFGLLGPNGGGKTTLFRILSTLLPAQEGSVALLGIDVRSRPAEVRRRIGVAFQSPSLDPKLTVWENLKHQGHLYGLAGQRLRDRVDRLLAQLGLADRRGDRAEALSGGLKRRVEIAKGLLHEPRVLLLDEPSTGLDPGARIDLWRYLRRLRDDGGVTVLVTTHLMEEAERCDRLAILDRGRLVALDTPDRLRASVGGDCLTIPTAAPESLAARIAQKFRVRTQQVGHSVRVEYPRGHELLRELVEAFPEDVTAATLGKPTLEDVFVARTGHRFWDADADNQAPMTKH